MYICYMLYCSMLIIIDCMRLVFYHSFQSIITLDDVRSYNNTNAS